MHFAEGHIDVVPVVVCEEVDDFVRQYFSVTEEMFKGLQARMFPQEGINRHTVIVVRFFKVVSFVVEYYESLPVNRYI